MMSTARAVVLLVAAALTGCGTYSILRSPDTLPAGHVDVKGGLAANEIGEVLPVVQGSVGLTDRLELDGQYEVYSAFSELRAQLLRSDRQGVSLSLGVGGGFATTFFDEITTDSKSASDGAVTASVILGRRFGWGELYLGHRSLLLAPNNYYVAANKAGFALHLGRVVSLFLEGGVTVHAQAAALGEAAAGFGFSL